MRRALRFVGLAGSILALASWSAPVAAQGVVKGKHGDWQVRCETPPGAGKELCALVQSIAAEDRPNIGLIVIVLKTVDGKNRLLRVIAPLGVLIPSGLGLKIDDVDIGHAGFVRCQPSGCIAEVVMEDKLIDQLKNGKNAVFIIFQTPEEGSAFARAHRFQGSVRGIALTDTVGADRTPNVRSRSWRST